MRFYLLVFALALSGCGLSKKFSRLEGGQTVVKIQRGGEANSLATLNGGVLVYAVRQDNTSRRASKFMATELSGLRWELPNGPYRFFALGFEEATLNSATNKFRCAKSGQVNLTGTETTVQLSLTYANCSDESDFQISGSYFAGTHQAKPLLLVSCAGGGGDLSVLTAASIQNACNGGTFFSGGAPDRIAVDQDTGKIYVSGAFTTYGDTAVNTLVRLNRDGTLDTSFSTGTGIVGTIQQIVITSSGKIMLAGSMTSYNSNAISRIVRLNSDGSLDATFSLSGANGVINSLIEMPNGQMYIAGDFNQYAGNNAYRVARINANGTFDNTFSSGTSGFDGTVLGMVRDSASGDIILVGSFTDYDGNMANGIIRLNSVGTMVSAYGTGFSGGDPHGVYLDSSGQLWIWGTFAQYQGTNHTQLVRVDAAGGTLDVGLQNFDASVKYVKEISGGKFVVAGAFTDYGGSGTARGLLRLNSNLTLDGTFSNATVGANSPYMVYAAALDQNGNTVVVGDFSQFANVSMGQIARINSNGGRDNYFAGTRPFGSSKANYIKISMLEYDLLNGNSFSYIAPRTHSDCISNPAQGSHTGTNIAIPTGTLTNPIFGFRLETFDDSSCNGTTDHSRYTISGGLAGMNSASNRLEVVLPTATEVSPQTTLFRNIPSAAPDWNRFFFREIQ